MNRILGVMPMVAMFIVFDFVVHNPLHPETRKNLSYLDIIAAHYARLDLLAQGTIHDAKVAEFTSIARLYVESLAKGQTYTHNEVTTTEEHNIRQEPLEESVVVRERSDEMSQFEFEQLAAAGTHDMVRSRPCLFSAFSNATFTLHFQLPFRPITL
jgi:hypothetical protein